MDYQTEEKLAVRTSLSVEEHARVRLVQLQHTAENSLVYNQIEGECAKMPVSSWYRFISEKEISIPIRPST